MGQGIDEHWAQLTRGGIRTLMSDDLGTVVNSEVTDQYKMTGAFGETLQSVPETEIVMNEPSYLWISGEAV